LSSDNPDIRQQVDDNRGILKKLQLLIPGLRGYRQLDDLRVADDLLRNQVANKLDQSKADLEGLRKQMASAGDFTNLTQVGSLISQIQQLSGQIRHSEMGYSGIAASIQINQARLNNLYDYDYNFVNSAVQLNSVTSNMVYDPSSPNFVKTILSNVANAISTYKQKWSVRMEAIEGILVK
jgi:uncharacterized tellurite resistance protein B-like protein